MRLDWIKSPLVVGCMMAVFFDTPVQASPQPNQHKAVSTSQEKSMFGQPLLFPEDPFVQIQHCPQGKQLFSLHEAGSVVLWNAQGRVTYIGRIKNAVPETAVCTADEKLLLVGYRDGYIRGFDTQTGTVAKEWKAHNGPIYSMVLFDHDQQLATGGEDGGVWLWNVATTRAQKLLVVPTWEPEQEITFAHPVEKAGPRRAQQTWQPPRSVLDLAVSPSGEHVAAIGPYGRVIVWDATISNAGMAAEKPFSKDEQILWHALPSLENKSLGRIALSEDGHNVVLRATLRDPIEIHEIYHGNTLSIQEHFAPKEWRAPWAFSPTRSQYFGVSEEPHVPLVKDTRGEKFTLLLKGLQQPFRVAGFSPQGQWVAASGKDPRVCLWETTKGTLVACGHGHQASVDWLDFSPNGKTLVSVDDDKKAYLWVLPFSKTPAQKP